MVDFCRFFFSMLPPFILHRPARSFVRPSFFTVLFVYFFPITTHISIYVSIVGISVPNRPGARRGPAGGLPRAPDGTGRLAVVRPVRPKGRTAVFG